MRKLDRLLSLAHKWCLQDIRYYPYMHLQYFRKFLRRKHGLNYIGTNLLLDHIDRHIPHRLDIRLGILEQILHNIFHLRIGCYQRIHPFQQGNIYSNLDGIHILSESKFRLFRPEGFCKSRLRIPIQGRYMTFVKYMDLR